MLQIACSDWFPLATLWKGGVNSNKTLPFYWNKPLLFFGMQFYGFARTVRSKFSFHDEIVDRVDMRNPSNVLLDNWAFI
jgi:hypothetical protein